MGKNEELVRKAFDNILRERAQRVADDMQFWLEDFMKTAGIPGKVSVTANVNAEVEYVLEDR